MSYDVYLMIDAGGPEPVLVHDVGNYTSNVAGMWNAALGFPLDRLHGSPAVAAIEPLAGAVESMRTQRQRFEAMNPESGWGDYDGALDYLVKLLECCRAAPKAFIEVSC